MQHKGKHVHHPGHGKGDKPGGGHDFFGHGDAIREALSRRLPKAAIRALDVGTGFGRNAVFLAHHLAQGSHVWSVDPSQSSLERGSEAVKTAGLAPAVTLVPGAAEHLPFADNAFHVTMAAMIFHHLVSLPPALKEMTRVTRLGGKLLLVDWAPTAHLLPFTIEHRADDFFTARAVVGMLRDLGLEPVSDQHPVWYVVEAVKK
jgi:ubiquinone/menaquinone biosynthesis C-methylase UbiE